MDSKQRAICSSNFDQKWTESEISGDYFGNGSETTWNLSSNFENRDSSFGIWIETFGNWIETFGNQIETFGNQIETHLNVFFALNLKTLI
jgi:hypothetical protein